MIGITEARHRHPTTDSVKELSLVEMIMTHGSFEAAYFARRARQSHRASDAALDVGPAGIHATLALAYDRLAQAAEAPVVPESGRIASDNIASEEWDNEGGAAGKTGLRTL